MNERQYAAGIAAGLVLASLAIAWLASPMSPFASLYDPGEGGATSWRSGVLESRRPFIAPGGLYHPSSAGAGRTDLMLWGWDWIASPPAEAAQVGVSNG